MTTLVHREERAIPSYKDHGYAFADLQEPCSLCESPSLVDVFTNPCSHGFHSTCLDGFEKLKGKEVTECPRCDISLLGQKYIFRTVEFTSPNLSAYRCSTCYDSLDSARTCLTVCGHVFHNQESCLPHWLAQNPSHPTCPDCRYEMPFQGIWKVVRQYISYQEQQHLIKTIVAVGLVIGVSTAILGAYSFSAQAIAVGAVFALSALVLDSANRNSLPDLFLSSGLLFSAVSFTMQAYLVGIVALLATVYVQNSQENSL